MSIVNEENKDGLGPEDENVNENEGGNEENGAENEGGGEDLTEEQSLNEGE